MFSYSVYIVLCVTSLIVTSNGDDQDGFSRTLYEMEDNIQMLNSSTLPEAINAPAMGKLVQFFNIFCGNCRRFSPTFKKLARDLHKWNTILRIYAVDCAQEENVVVCRNFKVRRTPSLRFYGPNYLRKRDGIGAVIPSQEANEIVSMLSEFLAKNNYSGSNTRKPIFEYLNQIESLPDHFASLGYDAEYLLLIHQPNDSSIGRDTILDLLPHPAVAVRVVQDTELFCKFQPFCQTEVLALFDQMGELHPLAPVNESSAAYVSIVEEFLQQKGHTRMPTLRTIPPNFKPLPYGYDRIILDRVLKEPTTTVYRADLEQAIDKLLHVQLPKISTIKKQSFRALTSLIGVLNDFNPLNIEGKKLMKNLKRWLGTVRSVRGAIFADKLKAEEMNLGKIFKAQRFVGCIATLPFLRGNTCTWWTLFHYLTVEAAKRPKISKPTTVLRSLRGFVTFFFGCSDCTQHFLEMARRRQMLSVKTHDQAILWLWEAHNEVNRMLVDDTTEDPAFPKIQFPSEKDCPKCRDSRGGWDQAEVLKFLKRIYDIRNVSYFGLPTVNGYR